MIKDEEAGDNEDILGAGDPAYNPDDDLVSRLKCTRLPALVPRATFSRCAGFCVCVFVQVKADDADLPQSKSRAEIERAEKASFLMVREDIGEDESAMNTVD